MKKYEGLFILNIAGKEENVKDLIDKITAEITTAGGQVETVQKMDKRLFARKAGRKHSSGFYANVIFECPGGVIAQLRKSFVLNENVLRVLFTQAPPPKPAAKPS